MSLIKCLSLFQNSETILVPVSPNTCISCKVEERAGKQIFTNILILKIRNITFPYSYEDIFSVRVASLILPLTLQFFF